MTFDNQLVSPDFIKFPCLSLADFIETRKKTKLNNSEQNAKEKSSMVSKKNRSRLQHQCKDSLNKLVPNYNKRLGSNGLAQKMNFAEMKDMEKFTEKKVDLKIMINILC